MKLGINIHVEVCTYMGKSKVCRRSKINDINIPELLYLVSSAEHIWSLFYSIIGIDLLVPGMQALSFTLKNTGVKLDIWY